MENLPPQSRTQINKAIAANQKILAIKIYRDATGCDLKASKEFVESLQSKEPGAILDTTASEFPGVNDDTSTQILDAIFTNRKLDAVKKYKAASGCRLKESKEFIEQLTVQLKQDYPEQFRLEPASGGGCTATILAIGIGVCLVCFWVLSTILILPD